MTLGEIVGSMGESVTITLRGGESISGRIVGYETVADNEGTPSEGREDVLLDFGEWAEAVYVDEIADVEPYDGEEPSYYSRASEPESPAMSDNWG